MIRVDAPGPLRRRGPRPLWLHLGLKGNLGQALPSPLRPGGPPPSGVDPELLAGIAAYRRHAYRRDLADPPAIWTGGESRLLDYGRARDLPVLFVPSLINRAYVLDLAPGRSMLRWLAARGVRPLLLDWGWPGPAERRFDLTAIIAERLEPALASVGRPVVLAGYCMGGLLAMAAALRRRRRVRALALLATPWDFHADDPKAAARLGGVCGPLEPLMAETGALPIDALQAMFAALDPEAVPRKYRAFAKLDPAQDAARDFVALEDWLNDGVPLAAPIAREVFSAWYRDNLPAQGRWEVGGAAVRPQDWQGPTFVAVPARDRIVPPRSALALAQGIPGAVLQRPGSGHIGMVAGPRAETALWRPLLDWLLSH